MVIEVENAKETTITVTRTYRLLGSTCAGSMNGGTGRSRARRCGSCGPRA